MPLGMQAGLARALAGAGGAVAMRHAAGRHGQCAQRQGRQGQAEQQDYCGLAVSHGWAVYGFRLAFT